MTDLTLVQPILVSDSGTHEDTVLAVALASVRVYELSKTQIPEAWEEWLSGRFTKTVRRVSEKDFQKVLNNPSSLGTAFKLEIQGNSKAIALPPLGYSRESTDFPQAVKRAQVRGTDYPKEYPVQDSFIEIQSRSNVIVINSDLNMTTGKESAQAAHGAWKLNQAKNWIDTDFEIFRTDAETFEEMKKTSDSIITDSGLTEFDGPTDTVQVFYKKL